MNISSKITSFKVVEPMATYRQEDLLDWLAKKHAFYSSELSKERMETLVKRCGVRKEQIAKRMFDIEGYMDEQNVLFPNPSQTQAPIEQRMMYFKKRSSAIFEQFYQDVTRLDFPDHIVHVTCTGYVAPSAPQQMIVSKPEFLEHGTKVTHAYHMGCYAALPATRMAHSFLCSKEDTKVDVVHTEMCSLHLNPEDHELEQLVVQTLFADGFIKYTIEPNTVQKLGFKILQIKEQLIPDSSNMMTWVPYNWGLRMTLSKEVPLKIKEHLRNFLLELCAKTPNVDLGYLLKNAIFAVHPGGPKIIDGIEEILELKKEQLEASRYIFKNRGNMSSATLPHVWEYLTRKEVGLAKGTYVVSLAFGPGLTIFGSLFQWE